MKQVDVNETYIPEINCISRQFVPVEHPEFGVSVVEHLDDGCLNVVDQNNNQLYDGDDFNAMLGAIVQYWTGFRNQIE